MKTYVIQLVLFAGLGFIALVGCSSKGGNSSLRCEYLRGTPAYNSCLADLETGHEWYGALTIKDPENLKRGLRGSGVCDRLDTRVLYGLVQTDRCSQLVKGSLHVLIASEDLTSREGRFLITAEDRFFNHNGVRNILRPSSDCGPDEYCGDQFITTYFNTTNKGKDEGLLFGELRLVIQGKRANKSRSVKVFYNGYEVAAGKLSYVNFDDEDEEKRKYCETNYDPQQCRAIISRNNEHANFRARDTYDQGQYYERRSDRFGLDNNGYYKDDRRNNFSPPLWSRSNSHFTPPFNPYPNNQYNQYAR